MVSYVVVRVIVQQRLILVTLSANGGRIYFAI